MTQVCFVLSACGTTWPPVTPNAVSTPYSRSVRMIERAHDQFSVMGHPPKVLLFKLDIRILNHLRPFHSLLHNKIRK